MHLSRRLRTLLVLIIATCSHNVAKTLPVDFWPTLLHGYSQGSCNADFLAATTIPIYAAGVLSGTDKRINRCLGVTAEHFDYNPKKVITYANSAAFNLVAFGLVTNLPTAMKTIETVGTALPKLVSPDMLQFFKTIQNCGCATNITETLEISPDITKYPYSSLDPATTCRNLLLACAAGHLFVLGVGNAVYCFLSTESGEDLIRKLKSAWNAENTPEKAATSHTSALINQAPADTAVDSSKVSSEAQSATQLVAKTTTPEDQQSIEVWKAGITIGSQAAAASLACFVLPKIMAITPGP